MRGAVVFVIFLVVVGGGVVEGTTGTSLSFVNIVNPAIGMLETFFNFTFAGIVVGGGVVVVDPELVEVFMLGFGFAKGLNCEKKFVPVVPSAP